jgi:Zn-dependent metalloprotease
MTWFNRLFASIILLLSAWPPAFGAAGAPTGGTPAGFLALSGEAARDFDMPPDMPLENRETPDQHGVTRERHQQYVGDAKVLGAQITRYRDAAGAVTLVIGAYYPGLRPSNRRTLAPADVRKTVESQSGPGGHWDVDLLIDPQTGRYFYRVENRRFDSRTFYWIDAENGQVMKEYDGLTPGQGTGVKGDTKDLAGLTTSTGSTFALRSGDGRQLTYDARNRPRDPQRSLRFPSLFLPGALATDADDQWVEPGTASPGQPALVDAHYYARVTDLYYQDVHGRNSLDGAGLPMVSTAHYSRGYLNAFWNGSQMVYGDGGTSGGASCREMSGALDIVGHELTHGVTEFTSGLIYQEESGALNESFSDIMGSSIEFFAAAHGLDPAAAPDFLLGEDACTLDGAPGSRSMADPAERGDPDHYSERFTGTEDNGGVHINSGIPNHAYYLLVTGGRNAGEARGHPHSGPEVAGIGVAPAEQIFYLAFTALPENATMCHARLATQAVAGALFPATLTSVSNAWVAVGVPDGC